MAKDGVDVAVLHSPTIKPLDDATILKACSKPGRIVVVAENHTTNGGLGEAIAEEMLPVKIVCALPGLTTGYGPSHQATEDVAIFRGLPNMPIVDPCDAFDIEQAVPAIVAHNGPVCMRLLRGNVPLVLDE